MRLFLITLISAYLQFSLGSAKLGCAKISTQTVWPRLKFLSPHRHSHWDSDNNCPSLKRRHLCTQIFYFEIIPMQYLNCLHLPRWEFFRLAHGTAPPSLLQYNSVPLIDIGMNFDPQTPPSSLGSLKGQSLV